MLTERIRCDSIYKLSQDESSLKIKQLKKANKPDDRGNTINTDSAASTIQTVYFGNGKTQASK